MKLRGALEENSNISDEIASMKLTLMRLQTERLKSSGRSAHETDAALAKVPALLFACLAIAVQGVFAFAGLAHPAVYMLSLAASMSWYHFQ